MPTDRPLRNLTRDRLLGMYADLLSEPGSKKYNLRKELQTDKRENVVYANRWLTREQFLDLARQEIAARGLPLPDEAAADAPMGAVEPMSDAGEASSPADSAPVDAAVAAPVTEASNRPAGPAAD